MRPVRGAASTPTLHRPDSLSQDAFAISATRSAWRRYAAARANAALAFNQNIENNPMQSSMVVAGIDGLSDPAKTF